MTIRRALLHSGGNARGAVGVPVLERLHEEHGPAGYAGGAGVSVGMVNIPEFFAGNLAGLRDLYLDVTGLSWYLRMRWPWQWGTGVYSLDRLRARIQTHGSRRAMLPDVPIYAGVYDYESDEYRSIDHRSVPDEESWLDARLASMAIPVVMHGWNVRLADGIVHTCYDGGMRAVIPDLPDWHTYDEIDVILCSTVDRCDARLRTQVDDFREIVSRSVDVWIDGVVQRDLERLQRWANAGVRVRLFAPRGSGGSFDASPEAMRARLWEGAWMADHPTILTPEAP